MEKVHFLEENGKRKNVELEKLRLQTVENAELRRRVQQTEEKLANLEKLIKKTLEET